MRLLIFGRSVRVHGLPGSNIAHSRHVVKQRLYIEALAIMLTVELVIGAIFVEIFLNLNQDLLINI